MPMRMITVPVDDIECIKVGSLAEYQHKLRMANDPEYRAEAEAEAMRPTTLRAVLGIPEGLTMRTAFCVAPD